MGWGCDGPLTRNAFDGERRAARAAILIQATVSTTSLDVVLCWSALHASMISGVRYEQVEVEISSAVTFLLGETVKRTLRDGHGRLKAPRLLRYLYNTQQSLNCAIAGCRSCNRTSSPRQHGRRMSEFMRGEAPETCVFGASLLHGPSQHIE